MIGQSLGRSILLNCERVKRHTPPKVIDLLNGIPAPYKFRLLRKLKLALFEESKEFDINHPKPIQKSCQSAAKLELLILVPHFYSNSWEPGTGNFFFEIYRSAMERYPSATIELVFAKKNDSSWIIEVVKILSLNPGMSLLANTEKDPSEEYDWNFEILIGQLREFWTGGLLAIMFDSVWEEFLIRNLYLSKIVPRVKIIAIDRDISQYFPRRVRTAGPTLLPISKESIDLLVELSSNQAFSYRLTFLGKIYDYRRNELRVIKSFCPELSINPRLPNSGDYSYQEYFKTLASSRFSLNLSRANAQNVKQLKCRVLEAALAGSVVATDERKWMSKFFEKDEYIYIASAHELQTDRIYCSAQADYQKIREKSFLRAKALAPSAFWETVESLQ